MSLVLSDYLLSNSFLSDSKTLSGCSVHEGLRISVSGRLGTACFGGSFSSKKCSIVSSSYFGLFHREESKFTPFTQNQRTLVVFGRRSQSLCPKCFNYLRFFFAINRREDSIFGVHSAEYGISWCIKSVNII